MTWRVVVIDNRAKLELKLSHLVVRQDGNKVQKIYLKDISHIIVNTTEASITFALLNEIVKNKIKLIFCDETRNPTAEVSPLYSSYNTSEKIRLQIKWDEYTKGEVWQQIVKQKIKNQRNLLEAAGKPEYALLEKYIEEVELKDATNREGHAAKVYFNALFGKSFSRSDDSNINAALNYGYAILLASINRQVVSNGYLTQIGIFHDNMFNQFNFSSDLIEPWRVLVDNTVYIDDIKIFGKEQKIELINLINEFVTIDNKYCRINQALEIYIRSVFDALNNRDISLLRFPSYEL
ncbi:CRISPR-associated endonuclease Cas1, NMENI subtype [Peptoniphilus duerdenii ATCC BAA-1640]|uniref:CRISPR-associated endonuclease Cas1 n=1 Tax=Peptoniphilus duerdenii ATCC BAA-1640 TaxID=862517 RepID=E0NJ83_9FIRM|nr:type II CRISPR-associated endonuclease Cas1 [Peptoniphilus duerdenii]EFM26202.1 CRISPR-associated endonuclease Cas1, NMENI subtype [Peptoniphilus duerdenii ATCC BAA-1640]